MIKFFRKIRQKTSIWKQIQQIHQAAIRLKLEVKLIAKNLPQPSFPVQTPVLNSLTYMMTFDTTSTFQIGYGPGYF